MLGAINVGTWGFFSGAIAPWFPSINVDATTAEGFRNQIVFVAAITGIQALINHFGIRLTAKLTDFSGYLIFAATIVLTLACFAFAEHWDFTRLWTFDNFSGDPTLNAANELKGDPVWPNKVSGLMVFLLEPAGADLHDHRLRRLGPYVGGDPQGRNVCAARHGQLGVVVVDIRLRHADRLPLSSSPT